MKHRAFPCLCVTLPVCHTLSVCVTVCVSHCLCLQASPDHASRIEAGAAASTSGRSGIPTKVMLHKKSKKQYTNLAVVQELYAHTGEALRFTVQRKEKAMPVSGHDGSLCM